MFEFPKWKKVQVMQFRKIIKAISSAQKNETQTDSNYTENDSQDNQYETLFVIRLLNIWKT